MGNALKYFMTIRNHTTWVSLLVPQGQHNAAFCVPQGQYFINRRLQPTGVTEPTLLSPAWDDTLLFSKIAPISSAVPCGTKDCVAHLYRRLKSTVNKVLSLRVGCSNGFAKLIKKHYLCAL